MNRNLFPSLCAAAVLSLTALAWAQGGTGKRSRMYDPTTEVTVQGTVQQVQTQAGRHGRNGTHLLLKTDSGDLTVHVGPSDYIASQGFSFAAGDQVQVTGSKVKMNGTDVVLAREIRKDGKLLPLRDAQGIPKWAGGRKPS